MVYGLSGNLTDAYNYVVQACNDNNIGYSQSLRKTIKLDQSTRTYCDCSSLLSWSLTKAGFFKTNPWFATADANNLSSENYALLKVGFETVSLSGEWKPGDILWRYNNNHGHTEMVYKGGSGKGISMGAHSSRYTFKNQVSISETQTTASKWMRLYRYGSGALTVTHWIQSNSYLDSDSMYNNAVCVYNYFSKEGFTNAAIAGLLGNMQQESTINPGLWQNLSVGSGGYGLVQWTPASNYRNWASNQGIDLDDADDNGDGQCKCINEHDPSTQWIPTSNYPESWEEFKQLTDYAYATKCFLYNYERAGSPELEKRLNYAKYWYSEIDKFPSYKGDSGSVVGDMTTQAGIISDLIRRMVINGHF